MARYCKRIQPGQGVSPACGGGRQYSLATLAELIGKFPGGEAVGQLLYPVLRAGCSAGCRCAHRTG